MVLPVSVE